MTFPFKPYIIAGTFVSAIGFTMNYYLLNEKKEIYPVSCEEWANRLNQDFSWRKVKKTFIKDIEISTVFLGLNHNYFADHPPLVFETMIFWNDNKELNNWAARYSTYKDARLGHNEAVRLVIKELREKHEKTS